MRNGIQTLLEDYLEKFEKYQDLCQRSVFDSRIPLIDDLPVSYEPNSGENIHGLGRIVIEHTDLTQILHSGTPHFNQVAASFALAETLFQSKLGATVTSHLQTTIENLSRGPSTSDGTFNYDPDGHFTGAKNELVCSKQFLAIAACIHEFRRSMPEAVIAISSEMGRAPLYRGNPATQRFELVNSLHGWRNNTLSCWGPDIVGPLVIGCIREGIDPAILGFDNSNHIHGSVGESGTLSPVHSSIMGVKRLRTEHLGSLLCEVLGVPSPTPNFHSPIRRSGGGRIDINGSLIGKLYSVKD